MPDSLRYIVLPVGQGTGTLIEVLDGAGTPTEITLIDLGSKGWSTEGGIPSADFVIAELKRMAAPRLETIFLSHSDGDHVNLIKRVLDQFKKPSEGAPPAQTLTIEQVWYGGDKDDYVKTVGKGKTKKKLDLLALIKEYKPTAVATNINELGAGSSSWKSKPAAPIWKTSGGVEYWLLYGNASKSTVAAYAASPKRHKGSAGYLKNVVSLVLIVQYGTDPEYLVALGDATGLTIAGANQIIKKYKVDLPRKVATMSLPHHGSKTTTYDFLGTSTSSGDAEAFAKQSIEQFVKSLQPDTINASAGEQSTFKHPAWEVVRDFGAYLGTGRYVDPRLTDQHFFTAYYTLDALALTGSGASTTWPAAAGWQTGRTDKNVFTLDYFRGLAAAQVPIVFPPDAEETAVTPAYTPKPPRAAGWAWVLEEAGPWEVERILDRNFTAAGVIAVYEDEHGPLPPDRFVFVPSAAVRAEPPPPAVAPPAGVMAAPAPNHRPPPPVGLRRVRQLT
jgi:beta-lactamase superfamily II metal-dependent hydrolase